MPCVQAPRVARCDRCAWPPTLRARLELSHFHRDVLRQIVNVEIGETVVVATLDVDFEIERRPVLVQEISKPTASKGNRVVEKTVSRCIGTVERIPLPLVVTDPELCRLILRPDRRVHEFQLGGTD
jgi:hypothetical protein